MYECVKQTLTLFVRAFESPDACKNRNNSYLESLVSRPGERVFSASREGIMNNPDEAEELHSTAFLSTVAAAL